MSSNKIEEAIERCEVSSRRGIGMFEKFTDLTFKMLNDIRGLEVRIDGHEREMDILKEMSTENKETGKRVSESLLLIEENLRPLINKNRKLDKFMGIMSLFGVFSVSITVIISIILLVSDPAALISFITKIK
jgi:hypothetical protein